MSALRRGQEGAPVRALQVALNLKTGSHVPVTGRFDAATEAAVERAQRDLRQPTTGAADEALLAALAVEEGGLPW